MSNWSTFFPSWHAVPYIILGLLLAILISLVVPIIGIILAALLVSYLDGGRFSGLKWLAYFLYILGLIFFIVGILLIAGIGALTLIGGASLLTVTGVLLGIVIALLGILFFWFGNLVYRQ